MDEDLIRQVKRAGEALDALRDEDSRPDEIEQLRQAFEVISLSKRLEAQAYDTLGRVLGGLCYETGDGGHIPTRPNALTLGPVDTGPATRSLLLRAVNKNPFGIRISAVISCKGTDLYSSQISLKSCSTGCFPPVEINSAVLQGPISIRFEIIDEHGAPVCDRVFVFAAARADDAGFPIEQSHLLPGLIFMHTDFALSEVVAPGRPFRAG